MEIKEINKIIQSEDKDEKSKSVKCICINYGDFLADCEGFVQKRYHDFKCNPKHQFEKKADTILENAIHESGTEESHATAGAYRPERIGENPANVENDFSGIQNFVS